MKKFTFQRSERLSGKKAVEELFKNGSSFHFFPFLIRYQSDVSLSRTQVLIAVPKKYHRSAVHRNRIKRLVREAYRLNKSILAGMNHPLKLGIIYLSPEILSYEMIEEKLIQVLRRLSKDEVPNKRNQ